MDVDILKNKTYEMIELLDRKVDGIGEWRNNATKQILTLKIDSALPSKFESLPPNKSGYYRELFYLSQSAEKYLNQSYGFASATGILKITMSSHSNRFCGGYGIRIRILNSEGEECVTSRIKDLNRGRQLVWNNPSGGNCKDMEISWFKTKVYIESNSGNDFCPKVVKIFTKGTTTYASTTYATNEINSWYDSSSNSLQHSIHVVQD